MRSSSFCFLFLTISKFVAAQANADNDRNVVITKSVREFDFVYGNNEHPVQVKEESDRTYSCNNYRTDIPIVEFYNDQLSVDDVDIYTNGSRKNGIVPKYAYYNGGDN